MARDDHGGSPLSIGLAYAVEPAPAVQAWASAASTGPTRAQYAVTATLSVIFIALCASGAGRGLTALHGVLFGVFAAAVLWRSVATAIAGPPPRLAKPDRAALPPYSIIVPLYREAQMVSSLVATLARLDYPKDRLQILFVLEAGDADTLAALKRVRTTAPLQIVIAPPGAPQTKPRACNIALAQASGEHVVVYDAEDRPHPLQLQEATARFAGGGA